MWGFLNGNINSNCHYIEMGLIEQMNNYLITHKKYDLIKKKNVNEWSDVFLNLNFK